MLNSIEEKKINHQKSSNPMASAIDVKTRSQNAFDEHKSFFTSIEHVTKVNAVTDLLNDFFKVKKAVYVNHRTNRGRPFTAIKIEQPNFPNHLPSKVKDEMYRVPLRDLEVEIVFSKNTNSYLYRIY